MNLGWSSPPLKNRPADELARGLASNYFTPAMCRTLSNSIAGLRFRVLRPTFRKILKKGAVEGFEPEPYLASVLNCMLWVFYGLPLVHPDSILVVTINSIGLSMELIYVIIYFIYAPAKKRTKVVVVFFLELLLVGVVVVVTLLCFHDTIKRSLLVGSIAVVFNALMYSSPLLIMGKVIKTKSVEYMPFLLSLTSFLNGSVWVIYALLRFDPYILSGNVLGTLAGLFQLIIYAIYYKSTPKNKDNRRNESGLELPTTQEQTRG
ncbi:hypothetical protein NE237_005835 [Protea cynaroides]|uniref:Bidirectional sugar transporter SWEET n=1 Tax=Protea cynaroides TaxID=273540 RepID=A0A9Q0KLY9_9MAGN|nr:hypothetical protein NE237_005835 [Protea cynaroides]